MPRIHDCIRPEDDDGIIQLDGKCDCERRFRHITYEKARLAVEGSHMVWKKRCNANGKTVETHDVVLVTRREKHPPRARTISASDIDRAYVCGGRSEQERITAYGAMQTTEVVLFHRQEKGESQ